MSKHECKFPGWGDIGYFIPDVDDLRRVAAEPDAGRSAGLVIETAAFRPP